MNLIAYRLARYSHPSLIERMRVIYNSTIESLATHPIQPQTPEGQQQWWENLDHSRITAHLYSPVEQPYEIAAFSLVTDRGQYCTVMLAVAKEYEGRGYGWQVLRHYLSVTAPKPMRGEQLVSNKAICFLNARLGWQIVGEKDGTQFLFHPNGSGLTNEEVPCSP